MYPGWLDMGAWWGTWGRVSWYAPGATISAFMKGGLEHWLWCLCSEWLLPLSWPGTCTDIPSKTDHDIIRTLCDDDWHHMVTSHWCGGCWMMTFTSVLKGYKRKMHERVGVTSFKFWAHRAKLTSSRVLWCIQALGLPGISIPKLKPCV